MAAKRKSKKKSPTSPPPVEVPERILDKLEGSGGTKPCVKRWLASGFKSTQRRKLFRAICQAYLQKRGDGTVSAVGWTQFVKVLAEEFEREGFKFGQARVRKYLQGEWPHLYSNAS